MTPHVPPMASQELLSRLLATFPELSELDEAHRMDLLGSTQFSRLRGGDIAYRQGQHCHNYVMCIEGQTRVFKTSESGARSCSTRWAPARPACSRPPA